MKNKKKVRRFCIKCYKDEVYFVRKTSTTVMMRCKNCNAYIKWATAEEYEGHYIIGDPRPLF